MKVNNSGMSISVRRDGTTVTIRPGDNILHPYNWLPDFISKHPSLSYIISSDEEIVTSVNMGKRNVTVETVTETVEVVADATSDAEESTGEPDFKEKAPATTKPKKGEK